MFALGTALGQQVLGSLLIGCSCTLPGWRVPVSATLPKILAPGCAHYAVRLQPFVGWSPSAGASQSVSNLVPLPERLYPQLYQVVLKMQLHLGFKPHKALPPGEASCPFWQLPCLDSVSAKSLFSVRTIVSSSWPCRLVTEQAFT